MTGLQPRIMQREVGRADPLDPDVGVLDSQLACAVKDGIGDRAQRQAGELGIVDVWHA